ncbi:M1 family metallopeptidase [Parafilimonas sp.]|uniref:M1 family metallopeptidase n=1 Tax=Parafilimonas sp. TaxID=1969739 RepID=UPI0039E25885
MNKLSISLSVLCIVSCLTANAQPDRWQQRIAYNINVNVNVESNRFSGVEKIDYWNNSPDTLHRVFFHLYWNAFQPNSMMDVRSRELGKIELGLDKDGNTIYDWDDRVRDRIQHLQPNEIGYDSTEYVKLNGIAQKLIYHETILEVQLKTPLLPHSRNSFEVSFNCQVPVQIRRSGRDNAEGIRYSMSQWYPKMVEYDYQGWNANPYIAREFYGVWGDYNVNITIDKDYMLAGSGTLQNPNEVGYGYGMSTDNRQPSTETKANGQRSAVNGKLVWKFAAQNVHDFVWAADTAYTMIKKQMPNGPLFYFIYKKVDSQQVKWENVANTIEKAYPYIAKTFGAYPYKNYSFIQGGDGGMEYPMATLIKNASVGTAIHEFMHSWYQGMMGTNESLYPWMDEGFTTYAEQRVSNWLKGDTAFAFNSSYNSYFRILKSGREEALCTHADHFNTNYAYSVAAYSKGSIFLSQLGYIVGEDNLNKILLEYYKAWKFRHPNANDFVRVAEKVSGIELQWYKEYWVYTTKTIDYALGDINMDGNVANITVKRLGLMPMPVDILVTYKDGSREMHYIPLSLMYGAKPAEDTVKRIVHDEWKWVDPAYSFTISKPVNEIKSIEIDPSLRMADVNRVNNKIMVP